MMQLLIVMLILELCIYFCVYVCVCACAYTCMFLQECFVSTTLCAELDSGCNEHWAWLHNVIYNDMLESQVGHLIFLCKIVQQVMGFLLIEDC